MPDFRAYVRRNLPALGIPGEREAEIVEELALEFEQKYQLALRRGQTPADAWNAVTAEAGSWEDLARRLKSVFGEPPPEPRRASVFGEIGRDLRHGVRQFLRTPGFTLTAVITLALGIGANTAIFSLLNAVLLRSLPVSEPQRLVFFGNTTAAGSTNFFPGGNTEIFSYRFFRDFRRENQVFEDVAAISSIPFGTYGRVAGGASPERVDVELVSGSYFHTLGVNAVLGRVLAGSDDQTPGAHPVAVASYAWWQRRLAGDPSVIGKTVTIASTTYVIAGVAPPEFFGVTVERRPDFWIPLAMEKEISPGWNGLEDPWFQSLHILARPKAGISMEQAQSAANLLFHQILSGYPGARSSKGIPRAYIQLKSAATGRSELRWKFSAPLNVLMIVVALVLLIACANVANLLLARAAVRQREIAIRMSMGAARPRLIRQLLLESGLLGFTGAGLGVLFAWAGGRALLLMVSTGSRLVPIHVTPDLRVLGFTLAVTLLTVLLFGAAPAFRATAVELAPSLKQGRGIARAPMRNPLGRSLVAGQIALTVVLLAGAGLFLRSLVNLMNTSAGFDKNNVLFIGVEPGAAGYRVDARLESMMERVEQRVGSLPGIQAASFVYFVFNAGRWSSDDITVPGRPESETSLQVNMNLVGPQYLDVMKMPVILGRGLDMHDDPASRKVAVINETMARVFFPGGSPLGRTFAVGDDADLQNVEVVGVVKDARYASLEERQMPAAFFPHAQHWKHFLYTLAVRSSADPRLVVPDIRKALAEIDPDLPVGDVTTLAQAVDDSMLNRKIVAQLSTFFGALAAFLAAVGIYGVLSYGVARRRSEFGIRIALGAQRRNVLWLVLRDTLSLAVVGAAAGLALSLVFSRLSGSLLYGLKRDDPASLAMATLAMIAVALLAGYLPARRATRVDPATALRSE